MRRGVRILFVILSVLVLVPGWSGDERLALWRAHVTLTATRVALDPSDPARRRVGALTFLGGVALTGSDPAFGGYSSLAVEGDRFTLLSDGGNVLAFTMGGDWRPRDIRTRELPAGPGTGWTKQDRDAESFALAGGHAWVGLELANAIWRYDRDFARVEGHVAPRAMRHWPSNGGPEAMARLPDGRFVVLGETASRPDGSREALLFPGDPVAGAMPLRFGYRPPAGTDPSDATVLPDGRLLVLNRSFGPRHGILAVLTLVDLRRLTAGATLAGRVVARLARPLPIDNMEGVALAREGGRTVLWLLSDDNFLPFQRTLLLRFALDPLP